METCLSQRDLSVLLQLQEKVSLTISQLHKLCFKDLCRDSAYKGIAKLKRRGFVKGYCYDFGRLGKLEDLLFLTKAGFNLLDGAGLAQGSFKYKTPPNLIVDYAHRAAIIDYWISLESDLQSNPNLQLADFIPEFKKLANGKGITLKAELKSGEILQIRNDALFILRNKHSGMEHLFLLEIDRGTMPLQTGSMIKLANQNNLKIRSNLATKIEKVQNVFDHWHLATDNLGNRFAHFQGAKVVVITDTAQRTRNMLRTLQIRDFYRSRGTFLFSHVQETIKGALRCHYAEPMGHDEFSSQNLI